MTRARFSNHHLGIETGRHHPPKINPRSRRVCRLCDTHEVEDARHALTKFTGTQALKDFRQNLMLDLAALQPVSLEVKNLQALLETPSSPDLWDRLLNASTKPVASLVAPYVRKCLREFYATNPRYLSYDPATTSARQRSLLRGFATFLAANPGTTEFIPPCDGFANSDVDSGDDSDAGLASNDD